MSEYHRHFGRRNIIWKLTDVSRESLDVPKISPEFSIWLADIKTTWSVQSGAKDQHLGVYLIKNLAERQDFSIGFHVAILKSSSPGDNRFKSFNKSYGEVLRNASGCGFAGIVKLDDLFDGSNDFLVGNKLTLEIKLELIEHSKVKMPEQHFLLDNNEKLVNNEKYSDFVFVCSDEKKIHVLKGNIAVQCEAFAAMIDSGLSEAATNSATIIDVDSETMLELVRFMYCGRVNNMKQVQERLVMAANKYGLEYLKILCVSSMMENLTPDNVNNVFEIAKLLDEDNLKENCIDFIKCHGSRLQAQKEEFSKELWMSLYNSVDLKPIRINFENGKLIYE